MNKIVVYLDSDDYSKLSNPKVLQKEPELLIAIEKLRSYISDEIIEIRYSIFNVMELVHRDLESKEYAIGRAKLLKELTRNNALIRYDLLWQKEAISLINNQDINSNKNIAYIDDNNWWGLEASEFAVSMEKLLKEEIVLALKAKNDLGRNQRRNFEKLFIKNGKLTKSAIDYLKPQWESQENPPFHPLFHDVLIGYFCGAIAKHQLEKGIRDILNDAEGLVMKIFDHSDKGKQQFIEFIKNYGVPLYSTILESQFKLIEAEQLLAQVDKQWLKNEYKKLMYSTLNRVRKNILTKMYDSGRDHIKSYKINKDLWEDKVVNSSIGQLPALDTTLLLSCQSAIDKIIDKSKPAKNDFVDFSHASYAPYCDIFRADKRTLNLIKKIQSEIPALQQTKIVGKPENIPDAIEEILKK